jgi:uncharacterized membrane protein YphA (DoxX/SURF4 family)
MCGRIFLRIMMNRSRAIKPKAQLFAVIVAILLAGVFIVASYEKIADPIGFKATLHNYKLFPNQAVNALALFVPWWELVAGLGLLARKWRRAAAISTLFMGLVFLFSVGWATYHGLDINCGCFGHGDEENASKINWLNYALDVGIIAGSAFVAIVTPPCSKQGCAASTGSANPSQSALSAE